MSDMSHEQADSTLADALWWFRGFSASRPEDGRGLIHGLEDKLLSVRSWVKDLASGDKRLLGLKDREQAIVLTESEFDRVMDALHSRSSRADRDFAEVMLRRIYGEVKHEREVNAYDADIPF